MNHTTAEKFEMLLSPVLEVNESQFFSPLNAQMSSFSSKCHGVKPKDCGKLRNDLTSGLGSVYLNKYAGTHTKRKPFCVRSNSSAEAVLRERKVEIKDLECEVSYLKKRIKELNTENRTLLDVQCRQEKELKKLKGGVADIPALLRSHKEEIKAAEAVVTSLRRELFDCQKDLKTRSDIVLRKDHQLDKLSATVRKIEKQLRETNLQNKQLKEENKKLELENKKLKESNEQLKFASEGLKKKEQDRAAKVLEVQDKLDIAMVTKSVLEGEMCKLQKKYEMSLQNEVDLKKSQEIASQTVHTQTDMKELVSKECMTVPFNDVLKNADHTIKEDDQFFNRSINSKADGDSFYHKFGLKQEGLGKVVKPILHSPSKAAKMTKTYDVSTNAIRSNSLQTIHSKNMFCTNSFEDDLIQNRINRIFASESDEDCNKSFGSGSGRFVLNERQKPKRLFSNFTLQN